MDGSNLPLDTGDAGYRRHLDRVLNRRQSAFQRRLTKQIWLLLFVVLPTVATAIYYVGFAAYQYESEAKFVVRAPGQTQPGLMSGLLGGTSAAEADTYAVHDYILSRDALAALVKEDDLRTLFARPEADFLSRFPTLVSLDNFEFLYKYYLRHVDVDYNSSTGVSTLTVHAFRAQDAQRIASALLAAGEQLVNRMNDRARENALRDARKEVTLAEQVGQQVAARIAQFRNRETLLDPTNQSTSILQGVSKLQMELTQTRTQMSELEQSSPNSPLISAERRRVNALQAQIDGQLRKIAGSDSSMVPKITEYDALNLQREFAERQLASATTSLENARAQAQRQQLYLNTVVSPNEADYPAYPKRMASIAIVFATCFGAYTMVRLLIAAAHEHQAY